MICIIAFMSQLLLFCYLLNTMHTQVITNIILFRRNLLCGGECYLNGVQPIPDILSK